MSRIELDADYFDLLHAAAAALCYCCFCGGVVAAVLWWVVEAGSEGRVDGQTIFLRPRFFLLLSWLDGPGRDDSSSPEEIR